MERLCPTCNSPVTGTGRPNKVYCGAPCRRRAAREREAAPVVERFCPGCDELITGHRGRIFCSRQCQSRLSQRRRLGIDAPELDRPCGQCGEMFRSVDGRRDYCSEVCLATAKGMRQARYLYGIEPEAYRELMRRQDGVCAICRRPERTARTRLLCVDHCHETGQVRGLLCSQCNRAVGLLGDDPIRIRAAAAYVASNQQLRLTL